jgi:hypothetical protein
MVGGLNADDLPADVRRRIEEQTGERLPGRGRRSSKPRTTQRVGRHGRLHGWCGTCGVEITGDAAWRRHERDAGHHRLELVASAVERPGAHRDSTEADSSVE